MSNKMVASKIANPYAEAFLQLAISFYPPGVKLSKFFNRLMLDMDSLAHLLAENPQLLSFLKNPLNSNEAKKIVVGKCLKCFDRRISIQVINFLNLLIDKKRINIIEEICEIFKEKANEYARVSVIEVSSAIPLTVKQKEILMKKLCDMIIINPAFTEPFSKPASVLDVHFTIDPKILGGLIIKVGSKVVDLSLRGELQRIAKEMSVAI